MRDELIEKIHAFFGVDSMYYGVEAAALADHLLANGVIVPPCKVGQTIYWCDFVLHEVTEWTIARIDIYEDEIVYCNDCFDIFADEEIGVTVFLTREQAERALAERSAK